MNKEDFRKSKKIEKKENLNKKAPKHAKLKPQKNTKYRDWKNYD